jgi:hypothetical protein
LLLWLLLLMLLAMLLVVDDSGNKAVEERLAFRGLLWPFLF